MANTQWPFAASNLSTEKIFHDLRQYHNNPGSPSALRAGSLSYDGSENRFRPKLKSVIPPKKYSFQGMTPMTAVTKDPRKLPLKMPPYLMHTQTSFNKGKPTLQSDRGSVQVGAKNLIGAAGLTHQTGWLQ